MGDRAKVQAGLLPNHPLPPSSQPPLCVTPTRPMLGHYLTDWWGVPPSCMQETVSFRGEQAWVVQICGCRFWGVWCTSLSPRTSHTYPSAFLPGSSVGLQTVWPSQPFSCPGQSVQTAPLLGQPKLSLAIANAPVLALQGLALRPPFPFGCFSSSLAQSLHPSSLHPRTGTNFSTSSRSSLTRIWVPRDPNSWDIFYKDSQHLHEGATSLFPQTQMPTALWPTAIPPPASPGL